jgi:Zn-dependent protease with chaperone function
VGSVVSTPVVVLAAEDPFVGDEDIALARGLWLGPYQRVVVSQGLVDELETEELRAVVAHEHAHVAEYDDAALGLVVPVAASLLLVGQNVVLSLLDYRQREFRADAFAAERTSPAAVRSAVEQVATLGFDPEEDDGDPPADARRAVGFRAVPGAVPRSGGQSVFTPLFRPFLLSAAHPSVRERRDAVASGDGD